MVKNYIKIAFRNIRKYKGFSVINLSGLIIGMTCSILILLFVDYEFSYETFHKNAENIYRIVTLIERAEGGHQDWYASTPPILAPTLKEELPEVVNAAHVAIMHEWMTYKKNEFHENGFCFAGPEFLEIFSFSLIAGNPKTALNEPFSLLITEKMAEKYFGDENPMGKVIRMDHKHNLKITGIIKNFPQNTRFQIDFITPISTWESWSEGFYSWDNTFRETYIQLSDNADPTEFKKKLTKYDRITIRGNSYSFKIQPLLDIHFKGIGDLQGDSDVRLVYILSIIAGFIILIACFNYMNLSTARAAARAREIGIRKVVGANRHQLITQFMGETFVFSIAALFISIFLVYLFLPIFNTLINKELSFSLFHGGRQFIGLFCFLVFVGSISGSYPAFFLSSYKPVKIMKGDLQKGSKISLLFRNFLVALQFVITIVMILCTFVVFSQLKFIRNRNLGFKKDQVLILLLRNPEIRQNFQNFTAFKNELIKYSKISNLALSTSLPNEMSMGNGINWEGNNLKDLQRIHLTAVDYNFIGLYEMEIVKGRNFSQDFSTDEQNAYILNEAAAEELEFDDPIGKRITVNETEGEIIGIVKDFHSNSLHQHIEPLAFRLRPWRAFYFSVKVSAFDIPETIGYIEKTWKKFSPDKPIEYFFLDDQIDRMYRDERSLGQIFSYFAFLAIFIACLGLYGLVSYSAERKTKEIGIRKVFGANISNISMILSKEFLFIIIFANMIAWPIAWFSMNRWLQNFAYRVNLEFWIFGFSGILVILIAMISISYQIIKAATANPVDSLRYE